MTADPQKSSRLLAYLQLVRLPNVFTAMADIFMGFWLTHDSLSPIGVFLLLLAASSCLYAAGMVLNDVFDVGQDRRERPHRPIPSGRVPLRNAKSLGWSLMFFGIAAGSGASITVRQDLPTIMAIILAVSILLYDRFAKLTPSGPGVMGFCRTCNVLLGASALRAPLTAGQAGFQTSQLLMAIGIGVYIAGITWFARREAAISRRAQLTLGFIIAMAGIVLLWWFPTFPGDKIATMFDTQPLYWASLWLLVAALIGQRMVRAILRPEPALVQSAVKTSILSIILLDAIVVLAVRGLVPALVVLLLLIPAILLGRRIYST
jgi:4-hydroxybenzoate polyprenyltransferase